MVHGLLDDPRACDPLARQAGRAASTARAHALHARAFSGACEEGELVQPLRETFDMHTLLHNDMLFCESAGNQAESYRMHSESPSPLDPRLVDRTKLPFASWLAARAGLDDEDDENAESDQVVSRKASGHSCRSGLITSTRHRVCVS